MSELMIMAWSQLIKGGGVNNITVWLCKEANMCYPPIDVPKQHHKQGSLMASHLNDGRMDINL